MACTVQHLKKKKSSSLQAMTHVAIKCVALHGGYVAAITRHGIRLGFLRRERDGHASNAQPGDERGHLEADIVCSKEHPHNTKRCFEHLGP